MRNDAEFGMWLDEVDERWRRKFRRATWELALMTVMWEAAMIALLVLALRCK